MVAPNPHMYTEWGASDGELRPIMPEGQYFRVITHDRNVTTNFACFEIWNFLNDLAQKLSAHESVRSEELTIDLVKQAMQAINSAFHFVHGRIVTRANDFFANRFGHQPELKYGGWPIRWPGENLESIKIILAFGAAAFQTPQVRSNNLDGGVVDDHAAAILKPLYLLKAALMKRYFALEIRGDIGVDELQAVFRNSLLSPPLHHSLDDQYDSPATLEAEDDRALGDESAPRPTAETLEKALTGVEVWSFVPGNDHYMTAAEILRRMTQDGPHQPPYTPMLFSASLLPGGSSGSSSGGGVPGGTLTT